MAHLPSSRLLWVHGIAVCLASTAAASAAPEITNRARQFVEAHEAKIRPLEKAAAIAWWNANISGKDEDFQKKIEAQNRLDEILSEPATFRQLKELEALADRIDDPSTARAIRVLYLSYL